MRLGMSIDTKELAEIQSIKALYPILRHVSVGYESIVPAPMIDWSILKNEDISISLHPLDININSTIDKSRLRCLSRNTKNSKFIYLEEDLGLWLKGNMFLGSHLLNPPLTQETIDTSAKNIINVQMHTQTPLAIENPPIYWTPQEMDFWDFFAELCSVAKCKFAFDVGHYIGWALASNKGIRIPSKSHPVWQNIITIHISGIRLWHWFGLQVWSDKHNHLLSPILLDIAEAVICRAQENIHCVLLEMEFASGVTKKENINLLMSRGFNFS